LKDPIILSEADALEKQLEKEGFQSKKTLITGGAGFIGNWLCEFLALADVHWLDNLCPRFLAKIEHLSKPATAWRGDVAHLSLS